jgi:hypothetical protein
MAQRERRRQRRDTRRGGDGASRGSGGGASWGGGGGVSWGGGGGASRGCGGREEAGGAPESWKMEESGRRSDRRMLDAGPASGSGALLTTGVGAVWWD